MDWRGLKGLEKLFINFPIMIQCPGSQDFFQILLFHSNVLPDRLAGLVQMVDPFLALGLVV